MRITTTFFAASALALTAVAPSFAHDHGGKAKAEMQDSIVEIAVGNENFTTLVAALQAADLVGALSGEGPFTVFAPTNDAFAALPAGTVESLLEPENKGQLTAILTYHVLGTELFAEGTAAGTYELETLQGESVTVVVDSHGAVTVDGANVTTADIDASNGVIHVIDAVILPGQ
jgi:uncharacterized surface protein with fasciclin (FAS1) repeats